MNQPEFYVNGTDFPPEDENIADGSLFYRADGKTMRRVQGVWLFLTDLQNTKNKED